MGEPKSRCNCATGHKRSPCPRLEVDSRGQVAETEPQWNNPQSAKAYDHIERYHGPKQKSEDLVGRAGSTGNPQGQWLKGTGLGTH